MSIAQELYEGIELGEYGPTGLITYMRTDSLLLWRTIPLPLRASFRGRYGEEYYPEQAAVFKTKGNAQDARTKPFVRPTAAAA